MIYVWRLHKEYIARMLAAMQPPRKMLKYLRQVLRQRVTHFYIDLILCHYNLYDNCSAS